MIFVPTVVVNPSHSRPSGVVWARRAMLLFLIVFLIVTLTACGSAAAELDGPVTIRTPKPTFTPTAVAVVGPTPIAAPPGSGTGGAAVTPVPQPAAAQSAEPARAVVNGPLVNMRRGPGTDYEIVAEVERGAEFDIVGRTADGAWWLVCCVDGDNAWIIADFVDTLGDVDAVPIVDPANPDAPAQSAAAPSPSLSPAPAPADTPTPPAPQASFDLEAQEQFAEAGLVRVFLFVHSGNEALAGYALRITHDGQDVPVSGQSFAGQPGFTWPFQDARQRYQNFKAEFPDVAPAGVWVVQLIDANGAPAGPSATFTLAADDPQQELYVRYAKR